MDFKKRVTTSIIFVYLNNSLPYVKHRYLENELIIPDLFNLEVVFGNQKLHGGEIRYSVLNFERDEKYKENTKNSPHDFAIITVMISNSY